VDDINTPPPPQMAVTDSLSTRYLFRFPIGHPYHAAISSFLDIVIYKYIVTRSYAMLDLNLMMVVDFQLVQVESFILYTMK
jgi:hypothetical protein